MLGLFVAQKKKNKLPSKGRIQKEIEKLVRQYRIRSKKEILKKLIQAFDTDPSDFGELKEIVVEFYVRLLREPLQRRITSLVKEGTTDLRRVLSVLKREKFDVERKDVKPILDKIITDMEKTKKKYSRGRVAKAGLNFDDDNSPVKRRLRDQMRKSLLRKTRYRKQRFVRKECPKFRFVLSQDSVENDLRALVYYGERTNSAFHAKILLSNGRITDVQITAGIPDTKNSAIININEFLKSGDSKSKDAFLQLWLKNANKYIKFTNVQELLWFLSTVLNERFGLPDGVSKYLKDRFVKYLNELDSNLTKYVIEKAVENI
ncbi:hypothetical protein ACFL7D_05125 [candidate division KSB1 bacterium]